MALQHELAFWVAVGVVAVVAVIVFKVVASKIPLTPLQQLAAAV